MITSESEYPELYAHKIRLAVPLGSLTPQVEAWLKEVERRLQPIIDRAMELATADLAAYGATQKTPEEYVSEVLAPERPPLG